MIGKKYSTSKGEIRYWISKDAEKEVPQLVFLPGLTADHRLFDLQVEYFKGRYPIFVWDAPGHAESFPFEMTFTLRDKANWLDEILVSEGFYDPVIVGQSMGGYLGQMYSELFPEKLKGFISIDSAPLKREYYTKTELGLLKRMEPVYAHYPWKLLVKQGTEGVASSQYGRKLMKSMMMTYDGDQKRYAKLAGHGYRILAEAVMEDLSYEIHCPALLVCGTQDHAGSTIRYNREWHKRTGIPIRWIDGAGHNSNTDEPVIMNHIIEAFLISLQG